jgi:hypothetical protein
MIMVFVTLRKSLPDPAKIASVRGVRTEYRVFEAGK